MVVTAQEFVGSAVFENTGEDTSLALFSDAIWKLPDMVHPVGDDAVVIEVYSNSSPVNSPERHFEDTPFRHTCCPLEKIVMRQ